MPFPKQSEKTNIKKKLQIAGIYKKPGQFMAQTRRNAILLAIAMSVLAFFFADKNDMNLIVVPIVGVVFFFIGYGMLIKTVDAKISKKAKKIDKDVLFAGRFLLIKLNSGKPLINSLTEASQSYGVASGYFKDIVRDIELGTSLERALETSRDSCPSKKMKKILFQINNALKIGIDVTKNLEAVLEEISSEQLVEIKRYGKKLNSLTLFYMLLAVVVPSLGMTMFIVIAGLVGLDIGPSTFAVFAFFLLMIEVVFLTIFKSIRPNVNI